MAGAVKKAIVAVAGSGELFSAEVARSYVGRSVTDRPGGRMVGRVTKTRTDGSVIAVEVELEPGIEPDVAKWVVGADGNTALVDMEPCSRCGGSKVVSGGMAYGWGGETRMCPSCEGRGVQPKGASNAAA